MSESASVEVLSAEVRVLQVGSLQLTRSMYWQLDEAAPKKFQPFGRVKDNKRPLKDGVLLVGRDSRTGALVRCHALPPNWSPTDGPEAFTHWMRHWPRFGRGIGNYQGYQVARYKGFALRWRCFTKTSALLRSSGMSAIKLQSRYANWTGCANLRCGSSAARSTSTSCGAAGGRRLCVSWPGWLWRSANTTSSMHCR